MNKLKTSLLILMLLASISASAGYAPDSVQIALKKMYPTAAGIAWSQDKAYYVADFRDERVRHQGLVHSGCRMGDETDGLGNAG